MPSDRTQVITYFLEMERPTPSAPLETPPNCSVVQASPCTARFYRFLYREVGEPWLWYERWDLSDGQIDQAIAGAEVHVLWVGGSPAGYVELKQSAFGETQIIYFGLMLDFVGRGFGRYFLDWSVRRAFAQQDVERLWVHTCSLDHENALSTYQRAGFREFRREVANIKIPAEAVARRRKRLPTAS
jgi:GNAT superfamily N-acetyltransferase